MFSGKATAKIIYDMYFLKNNISLLKGLRPMSFITNCFVVSLVFWDLGHSLVAYFGEAVLPARPEDLRMKKWKKVKYL